jgi:DNA replication initiation complex subunit (GINS family)
MSDITTAKRLIAANSVEGARLLGAGVSRPIYQGRYNLAAAAALADTEAQLTPEERRLIAEYITDESNEVRSRSIQVRVTDDELANIRTNAEAAGQTVSDYLRTRALEP